MGLTVYGGGGKPEEEKTVTAGTSAIVVNPSSGKVMKKVTVNPTPTESKSITPTTSELTVTPSEGKHLSQVVVGAVEDVTPEVTAQTPVITQIAENLGVTITTPSGTNKQILQVNNANLLNIKNNAKKEGVYVWKKLTADGGDFINFVVSDSETSYPDGAVHTDGYWYEKFQLDPTLFGCTKYAVDEFTLASNTYNIMLSHSLGRIPTVAFIFTDEKISGSSPFRDAVCRSSSLFTSNGSSGANVTHAVNNVGKEYANYHDTSTTSTDSQIQVRYKNDSYYLKAGVKYTLITMV